MYTANLFFGEMEMVVYLLRIARIVQVGWRETL